MPYLSAARYLLPTDPHKNVVVETIGLGHQQEARVYLIDERTLVDQSEVLRNVNLKTIDRFCIFALASIELFVPDLLRRYAVEDVGIVVGNMLGGWGFGEVQLRRLYEKGTRAVSAHQATAWFPAAAQGESSIAFGLRGFSKTLSGSLLCGLEAMKIATDAIRLEHARAIIVGSTEALHAQLAVSGVADIDAISFGECTCFFAMTDEPLGPQAISFSIRQETCDAKQPWSLAHSNSVYSISDYEPFLLAAQPLLAIDELHRAVSCVSHQSCLVATCAKRKFTITLQRCG